MGRCGPPRGVGSAQEDPLQTGHPAPPALDYRQPPARDFRPSDVFGPLVAWAAFAGVVTVSTSIVLKFRQVFADFHVRLPGVTVVLLHLQLWLTTWYGLAVLWLIPVAVTALVWPAERGVKRLVARLGFVFTLLFITYLVVALGIPMMTIADGVNSQSGGK